MRLFAVKIQADSNVTDILNHLDKPIKDVTAEVDHLPQSPQLDELKKQLEQISHQYDTIKDQVKQTQSTISDKIMNTQILDDLITHIKPVREECPDVSKYLRLGNLLVLIVLAIASLLFIFGLCNNCFRSIATIIGYIMFNILIVFGIVSFLFLAAGSDFCLESKPLLRKHIKTPVLDYYLNCTSANVTSFHHQHVKRNAPLFDIDGLGGLDKFPQMPAIDTDNLDLNNLFTQVKEYIEKATEYSEKFNETLSMVENNLEMMCQLALAQQGIKLDNPQEVCNQLKNHVTTRDIIR